PDGNHPFRVGRGIVGPLQRLAHVLRDRPGDQQNVRVPRRGDEAQAIALEIVQNVVEGVDLELAAIARPGVDLAYGEAAAEPAPRGTIEASGTLGDRG